MKITVAICSWNRARLLDQTLESLSHLQVPHQLEWEIVLVDNNSTEPAVPFVISDWRSKLPLRSFIEKEQGHSAARNCAIREATGDYIVWTDNDVLVETDWLSAYWRAFQMHPEAAFFGGEIDPLFEESRPDWIAATWDICAPVYATRKLGDQEFQLDSKRLPYGANFAVRSDIQRKFPYDTRWGRKQTGMVGEDEVAVLRQIIDSGESGYWVPDARLKHVIPPDRASEQYVASYYHGQGVTNTLKGKVERSRFRIWLDSIRSTWSYRFHRRFSQPQVWVSRLVHASLCRGELAGFKLASSAEKTQSD